MPENIVFLVPLVFLTLYLLLEYAFRVDKRKYRKSYRRACEAFAEALAKAIAIREKMILERTRKSYRDYEIPTWFYEVRD